MRICLRPERSRTDPGNTHAYFPALAACCALLEYMAGLSRGNTHGVGSPDVVRWAATYLPQPAYDADHARVLFEAMRHPIAHRGIASGIWVDRNQGAGMGRRVTWKVFADARRPAVSIIPEVGQLVNDPPWPCPYSHRIHVHLKGLEVDIRRGIGRYMNALERDPLLLGNFDRCMHQLYPR